MYGAALPAGNYHGSLGRYAGRPAPTSQGASMRGLAKAQALGGVGLRGLGAGVDFCDSGWSAVGNLLGAAGSLITAQNTSSAGEGTPDAGWGAAGSGASALSTVWGTSCTNRAAAEGAAAQTAFNNTLAQQRLDNEMALANARMQGELNIAALAAQRQQNGGVGGISNQTLLIGAGVLGVVVLGALFLRK